MSILGWVIVSVIMLALFWPLIVNFIVFLVEITVDAVQDIKEIVKGG